MDPTRFDVLTRKFLQRASRRTLLPLLGGLLAAGVTPRESGAKHKRAKGRPCRKLKQTCKRAGSSGGRFTCCDRVRRLDCDVVGFSRHGYCCFGVQTLCSGAGECCRDLTCETVPALAGPRCCAGPGASCTEANDCCDGIPCTDGFCVTAPPPPPSPSPPVPPSCLLGGVMCPAACPQGGPCPDCCSLYCDANRHCA